MQTFLEWACLMTLGAAVVWQFWWMFLLDRWIQKWDAKGAEDRGEV